MAFSVALNIVVAPSLARKMEESTFQYLDACRAFDLKNVLGTAETFGPVRKKMEHFLSIRV